MKQKLRILILVVSILFPAFANAQIVVNFSSNIQAGCATLNVQFTDATVTTPGHTITHQWYFIRDSASVFLDTTVSTQTNPHISFSTPGYYTVVETVTDVTLGISGYKVDTNYIYASAPLNINFTTTYPGADTIYGCKGKSVTFINTSEIVPGTTYRFKWIINSTTILDSASLSATPSYTFTSAGHYDVLLYESSLTCNFSTVKHSYINIDSFPTFSNLKGFTTIDTVPCSAPVGVTFSNYASYADSFLWNFGDGVTSSLNSPTHTYLHYGNYPVTFTAYSPLGNCSLSITKSNYVRIADSAVGFTVSNKYAASNVFCVGDSIYLHDTSSIVGLSKFAWHDYASSISSTVNPTAFKYSTAGVYTILDSAYSTTRPRCRGYATQTVTINPLPIISITGDTTYRCSPPLTVHFSSTIIAATPPYQYHWQFGEIALGNDTSDLATPAHTYSLMPVSGAYNLILKITDNNGCKSEGDFGAFISMGPPTFNIVDTPMSKDSGCTPLPFIYTTNITPVNGVTIPYAVDSVTFKNDATDTTHNLAGTDTIYNGAYLDTIRFYYHLTGYGGCSYSAFKVKHVTSIRPDMTHVTFSDTLICPNTLVYFYAGVDSNTTSFAWSIGTSGPPVFHNVFDTARAFPVPGNYRIWAVGNLNGCTDTLRIHNIVHVLKPAMASIAITDTDCTHFNIFKFVGGTVPGVAGTTTHYRWDFGDGTTYMYDTTRTIIHSYPLAENTYTVTLTDSIAIDTIGFVHMCTNIDTVKIRVFRFVNYDSVYTKDSMVCKGKTDTIRGPLTSFGGKYARYQWYWGDGATSFSTTSNIASHTYTATGNYYPTMVIKNSYTCTDSITTIYRIADASIIQQVHVGGPTNVGFRETPAIGIAPLAVLFSDTTSDVFNINIRKWNFNAPPSPVIGTGVPTNTYSKTLGTDTTVTFPEGKYNIVMQDTDIIGCYASDTFKVVSQKVHAYFYTYDTLAAGCIGHTYTFHDTNAFCTHVWDFGDSSPLGSGQTPTHVYTANGTYTVKEWITTVAGGILVPGCMDSSFKVNYITVQGMSVSFNLTDTLATCPPLFTIATNTTIPPAGGYEFYWRITPIYGIVDSSNTPNNLYANINTSGTISTITLIAVNPIGCLDSNAKQNVQILGPAGKIFISKTSGCGPLLADSLAFIDTNGTESSISNITWNPGDGIVYDSSSFSINHNYMNIGSYYPYVVIDGGGCGRVKIPNMVPGHYSDSVVVFKLVDSVTHPTIKCFGDSATLTAYGAGTGGNYLWFPSTGLSCTTCATVVANPTVTTTYYVVVTTANGCFDTISTILPIDSLLHVTISGTSNVCAGSTDTLIASGSIGTYLWSPAGVLNCTTCGTVVATLTATDTIRVIFTDGICFAHDSFIINMHPIPKLSSASTDTVCDNIQLVYVPNTLDTPAVFTWSRAVVPGISNTAFGSTDSIIETLHNTTDTTVNVIYSYHILASGCQSDTTVKVTVHPTPRMASRHLDSVCSLTPYLYVDSSYSPSTNFTWQRFAVTGIKPDTAVGIGNISEILTDTIGIPVQTYYAFTMNAFGCIGRDTMHLIVNPTPVLISRHNFAPVCNKALIIDTAHASMSESSYAWSRPVISGISNAAGSGSDSTINEHLTNTSNGSIAVTYIYTITARGCTSDTNHIRVIVRPSSKLASNHTDTVCSGTTFNYIPAGTSTDSVLFTWTHPSVTGIAPLADTTGSGSIHDVLTDLLPASVITKYIYLLNDSGCYSFDTVSALVVHPGNPAQIITDVAIAPDNICTNLLYQNFGASIPADPGVSYNWSATNATICAVGNTSQFVLVNFNTGNVNAQISLTSGIAGCMSAPTIKTFTVNSKTVGAPLSIITFENYLYCLRNDESSYQWGYDVVGTLEGITLTGETYQYYYNNHLSDISSRYYWVKTVSADGCTQKSYYNTPNVGVKEVSINNTGIIVYPNPADNFVNVELNLPLGNNVKLELYNLLGQKLKTVLAINNKAKFNVSGLPNGSYFIVSYVDGVKNDKAMFIKN